MQNTPESWEWTLQMWIRKKPPNNHPKYHSNTLATITAPLHCDSDFWKYTGKYNSLFFRKSKNIVIVSVCSDQKHHIFFISLQSAYTQIAWHSQTRMFSVVFRITSLLLSRHITSKNELISNWEANHRPVVWLHPLESWNRPLMNG